MFKLELDLPAAARLDASAVQLAAAFEGRDILWLPAQEARMQRAPGGGEALALWKDHLGHPAAMPVDPNTGNGLCVQNSGRPGLQSRYGVNCGMVAPRVVESARNFTMAIIYEAQAEFAPLTLLTLNTRGYASSDASGNYLFLSDDGRQLSAKDTKQSVAVEQNLRASASGPRLVIVTISGQNLALASGLDAAQIGRGSDPMMDLPADLFIGCRGQRKGLQKTLGQSCIHEVFALPNRSLLLPRDAEDEALLLALRRYFLWEY